MPLSGLGAAGGLADLGPAEAGTMRPSQAPVIRLAVKKCCASQRIHSTLFSRALATKRPHSNKRLRVGESRRCASDKTTHAFEHPRVEAQERAQNLLAFVSVGTHFE
jgi:hypothetical protein